MKTVLLLLALTFTAVVAQTRTAAPTQKTNQVLADFRISRVSPPPKISAQTQRNVLSKVFRRYLDDSSKCSADFDSGSSSDPLRAARNAGQIVPSIVDMATGSFTSAGVSQSAYVISVSECNASHADNFGTKRVAIFSGPQLVSDVDVDFNSSIVRKTDLNGDGLDELLMSTGDMHQGILTETASLLSFQNGKMRVIQDFGLVDEDQCASEEPGSVTKASVISIVPAGPGDMAKLRQDNYRSSCTKAKRWRFLSTGKMPD